MTITLVPSLEPFGQVITGQQYDALPESSLRELVDGLIHIMATPTSWHQVVKDSLRSSLKVAKPADVMVLSEMEVRLRDDLRRIPDIVVLHRVAYTRERSRYLPSEVILVVEVVSPGSESTDRILKPVEYAHAGIPHYWRVELEPEIVVNTFRRADDVTYVRTGVFSAGDTVNAPGLLWARVPVDDLGDDG